MTHLTADNFSDLQTLVTSAQRDLQRIQDILCVDATRKKDELDQLDPRSPLNKNTKFLTERGIEVCYRLFDMGKTRYEVSQLMGLSFGATTHRYKNWTEFGGTSRKREPLEFD